MLRPARCGPALQPPRRLLRHGGDHVRSARRRLLHQVFPAHPRRRYETASTRHPVLYTDDPSSRAPRQVAAWAEAYLASTGIADSVFFGPEAEFYLFDSIRYENTPGSSFYKIGSEEAAWDTGADESGGNQGYKTP